LSRRSLATALVAFGLASHAFFVPISIAAMQIALGIAALGLLLDFEKLEAPPLDRPIIVFVAVCIASDLISPFGPPPLLFATLWRPVVGYFVVTHGLRKLPPEWPARLYLAAGAGLAIASIVGLVQYRTGVDLVHLAHLRERPALVQAPGVPDRFGAMGFFISRLTFGHVAALLTALIAGGLVSGTARAKWLWAVVAVALAAIAVTFDRGAWLGLAAAALVIILMSRSRLLIGAIALVALLAALNPGVRGRFQSSFSTSGNGDRVFIWARAKEIIADHPLRGIGFGNYPRVCGDYYDRVDKAFPMRTWAHNLELSTLAETGPLGLLAIFWLLGSAALLLWRRRSIGGLSALTAFVAIAQAHDLLYDNKVMYALWLSVALGASAGPRPARAA
jgi:putative inorganic carbon (HCO3(-)) transporter